MQVGNRLKYCIPTGDDCSIRAYRSLNIYYGGSTSYAPLSASYGLVADQCIVAKAEVKTPRLLFKITPQSKLQIILTENHNQNILIIH